MKYMTISSMIRRISALRLLSVLRSALAIVFLTAACLHSCAEK